MGRGHCCHPQYGSQISGTAGVGGQGRWGCIRALEWEGDPITLRTGPRGRLGKAGRPGQCKWSGDRAKIHACPVGGWGPAPLLRNTFIGANSRTPGVPGPHTPQSQPFLGCECAPLPPPTPWERTRGAPPPAAATAVPPAWGPPSGPLRAGEGGAGQATPRLRRLLRLQRARSARVGKGPGASYPDPGARVRHSAHVPASAFLPRK